MDKTEALKIYNKYTYATHRQHFVKREYLSNWSSDGKNILGRHVNEKGFRLYRLDDVCVSKDIYKIEHHFNELELCFLKNLYANYPANFGHQCKRG